jgi:lipoic acid synthetase
MVDLGEPRHVAEAVKRLGLKYVVITSVDRDDLEDGGAGHFAQTVAEIGRLSPSTKIEVLIPDFGGSRRNLRTVVEAGAEVIGHNIETVERLTPLTRDRRADYRLSVSVLRKIKEILPAMTTKSGLMIGLGESEAEILQSMVDVREAGVDILTLGQYLQPTRIHLPVVRYVPPEEFEYLGRLGRGMGFADVVSGPLVRSSYLAERSYAAAGKA